MIDEHTTENGHAVSELAVIEGEFALVPLTAIEVYEGDFEQLPGWPSDPDSRPYPVPADSAFAGVGYIPAGDLQAIAVRLIERKERFSHLRSIRIDYLWKRKSTKSKGTMQRGFSRLASDLLGYYGEVTFIIGLAADTCRDERLTYRQVEAAVHHELMHAGVHDETYAPVLWPHDFEGFEIELEDYGIWAPGVAPRKSAKQMPLFEGIEL